MPNESGFKIILALVLLCTGCRGDNVASNTVDGNQAADEPALSSSQPNLNGSVPIYVNYNDSSANNSSDIVTSSWGGGGYSSSCSPFVVEGSNWVQCEQKGYTIQVDIRLKTPREFCDYCDCIRSRCNSGCSCSACSGGRYDDFDLESSNNGTKNGTAQVANSTSSSNDTLPDESSVVLMAAPPSDQSSNNTNTTSPDQEDDLLVKAGHPENECTDNECTDNECTDNECLEYECEEYDDPEYPYHGNEPYSYEPYSHEPVMMQPVYFSPYPYYEPPSY